MIKMPDSERRNFETAVPMTKIATKKSTMFKFERIEPEAQWKLSRHSEDVHNFVKERNHWESPATDHQAGRTTAERVSSTKSQKISPPVMRKEPVMTPTEPAKPASAEHVGRGGTPVSGSEGSTNSQVQKKSTNVPSRDNNVQNKADKVTVRTPPVVSKTNDGLSRKRPPSRPAAEQNNQRKKRN